MYDKRWFENTNNHTYFIQNNTYVSSPSMARNLFLHKIESIFVSVIIFENGQTLKNTI